MHNCIYIYIYVNIFIEIYILHLKSFSYSFCDDDSACNKRNSSKYLFDC